MGFFTRRTPNRRTGDLGEDAAARYLETKGFRVLDRNWRHRQWELDLVCRDRDTVVFVEVKTRKAGAMGAPGEALTRAKQAKLIKAASHYLSAHGLVGRAVPVRPGRGHGHRLLPGRGAHRKRFSVGRTTGMSDTGTLFVVATPLGNADDLSPRARHTLTEADVVLAEDTRRAGLLFKRLGLERHGRLMSFFEHNEDKRLPKVLDFLEQGLDVALISDAGTPLLSDPGFTLVRACREAAIPVKPVPGPSAPVTALSASGLPPLPYTFLGFPPRKKSQTEKLFEAHRATGATLVFFERKDRLKGTLSIARDVLGDRDFCVARELTKEYEEFLHGRLDGLDGFRLRAARRADRDHRPGRGRGRRGRGCGPEAHRRGVRSGRQAQGDRPPRGGPCARLDRQNSVCPDARLAAAGRVRKKPEGRKRVCFRPPIYGRAGA